jgi:hypothetical protein
MFANARPPELRGSERATHQVLRARIAAPGRRSDWGVDALVGAGPLRIALFHEEIK